MNNKNPIKDWWLEPSQRRQKRKAKKRTTQREKASPSYVVGSYVTHDPSIVVDMQIVGSNINGMFRINITWQRNLLLYSQS
jgi:hypothetical protein